MLRDECGVLRDKWLPYGTMLITMAAVWPVVEAAKGPEIALRRDRLKLWFWRATFNQRYENQTNTRTEQDAPALAAWLTDSQAPKPDGMDRSFEPSQWRSMTPRQTALYKASMALLMSEGARDFHNGQRLTPDYVAQRDVDDHHVFPTSFLAKSNATAEQRAAADTILNRTLIDKKTNITILDRAPHEYLGQMRDVLGSDQLATVLDSHGLPSDPDGPFWTDDLDSFLESRLRILTERLESRSGWSLAPTPGRPANA
jgi:hypothetical protein